MPPIDLRLQGDGLFTGWSSIVGATHAWQALDDSDGTSHDGDGSYIVLPRQILPAGRVSFRMFQGAEHLVPKSITLRVGAKKQSSSPRMSIGFQRYGVEAYDVTKYTPGTNYSVATREFVFNPITGLPWADGDLIGLEPCLLEDSWVDPVREIAKVVEGSLRLPQCGIEIRGNFGTRARPGESAPSEPSP